MRYLESDRLDEREKEILKALDENPKGLGFNEICRIMRDREVAARKTVKRKLSRLVDKGFVNKKKTRKGKKDLYTLSSSVGRFNRTIERTEIWSNIFGAFLSHKVHEYENTERKEKDIVREIVEARERISSFLLWKTVSTIHPEYEEEINDIIYSQAMKTIKEIVDLEYYTLSRVPKLQKKADELGSTEDLLGVLSNWLERVKQEIKESDFYEEGEKKELLSRLKQKGSENGD